MARRLVPPVTLFDCRRWAKVANAGGFRDFQTVVIFCAVAHARLGRGAKISRSGRSTFVSGAPEVECRISTGDLVPPVKSFDGRRWGGGKVENARGFRHFRTVVIFGAVAGAQLRRGANSARSGKPTLVSGVLGVECRILARRLVPSATWLDCRR